MELDKFKRRLIRSVARLMLHERRPEEETWEILQKETGCDCKLLWNRMRALTIKKLKRLLAAEDCMDNMAAVARLSLSDWLLFDLVLVHEKIDVITLDPPQERDPKPLKILCDLVEEFGIEGKSGESLLKAWTGAAREYNSNGRQCSPMLLQRRWYQLKEQTRGVFYRLWNNYRGNPRLWKESSVNDLPSKLNTLVAKRYPQVITEPFPEWEELIQKELVVMPEDFERKLNLKSQTKTEDDKPDLVVIEPEIETIEVDSDEDRKGRSPSHSSSKQRIPIDLVAVKQEPEEEDGLSNVQILETTHIPVEQDNSNIQILEAIKEKKIIKGDLEIENSQKQKDETKENTAVEIKMDKEIFNNDDVFDEESDHSFFEYMRQKIRQSFEDDSNGTENDAINESLEATETKNVLNIEVNDLIKQKTDEFINMKSETTRTVDDFKFPNDMSLVNEDMEFVDDGIECEEEDDDIKTEVVESEKTEPDTSELDENSEETGKFDLKLLMEPVVYTTKLDDMNIFQSKPFDFVKEDSLIDSVIAQSKPVSKRSTKVKVELENTDALSQSNLSKNTACNDDLSHKEFSSDGFEDNTGISDDQKVKLTSYLLQKPRSRSYHPIQLCKNPDFNTRLKRLTAGFFSSSRNRQLLSACMPLTIDLHKAFEGKLVEGTLYLRNDGKTNTSKEESQIETPQISTVVPSAMPVQSLLNNDNTRVNVEDLVSISRPVATIDRPDKLSEDERAKRNKVINLRDLSEIRRINQKLLTAEVTPMRVDNNLLSEFAQLVESNDLGYNAEEQPIGLKLSSEDSFTDEPKIVGIAGGLQPLQATLIKSDDLTDGSFLEKRNRGRKRTKPYILEKPKTKPSLIAQLSRKTFVPWNKVKQTSFPSLFDDFLLTKDTLIKMINKLEGTDDYGKGVGVLITKNYNKQSKQCKLKPEEADRSKNKEVNISKDTDLELSNDMDIVTSPNPIKESGTKNQQAKETVKHYVSQSQSQRTNRSRQIYCCWAKEKATKLGTKKSMRFRHKCRLTCSCCCFQLLVNKIKDSKLDKVYYLNNAIELSDDESGNNEKANIPTPLLRVLHKTPEELIAPSCSHINNTCTSACSGRGSHLTVSGITAENDDSTKSVVPQQQLQPALKININFTTSLSSVDGSAAQPVITMSNFPPELQNFDVLVQTQQSEVLREELPVQEPVQEISQQLVHRPVQQSVPPPVPLQVQKPVPQPVPLLVQKPVPLLAQKPVLQPVQQLIPQQIKHSTSKPVAKQQVFCPKPTIDVAQRKIVIDASKSLSVGDKEKVDSVIYLNSKSITRKPKESPIFLGQNKILLTTVKFPRSVENVPHKNVPIAPKVIPALPLPAGVQLVLMPDGQLNYFVDPGVKLNSEQLAAMPSILSAVKQQIDICHPQTVLNSVVENPLYNAGLQSVPPILNNGGLLSTNADDVINTSITKPIEVVNDNVQIIGDSSNDDKEGELNSISSDSQKEDEIKNNKSDSVKDQTEVNESDSPMDQTEIYKSDSQNDQIEIGKSDSQNDQTEIDKSDSQKDLIEIVKCGSAEDETEINKTDIQSDTEQSEIGKLDSPKEDQTGIDKLDSQKGHAEIGKSENHTDNVAKKIDSDLIFPQCNNSDVNTVETSINISDTSKKLDSSGETEIISIEHTNNDTTTNVAEDEGCTVTVPNDGPSSRNLLSDLMEMSGISAEDATHDSSVVAPPIPNIQIMSAKDVTNFPELTPVTSLAELKYACERNGHFFKLDLDTGVILPINVCIKKNNKAVVPTLAPKTVIDLTEEGDDVQVDTKASKPSQILDWENCIKPIKLFKSVRTPTPNLLQRKRRNNPMMVRNSLPLLKLQERFTRYVPKRKRKQKLSKIEAKIDLVDSDAPMEEEYLIDSDSDTESLTTRSVHIKISNAKNFATQQSDDSSDEEPLAKKFKRLKDEKETTTLDMDASVGDKNNETEDAKGTAEVSSEIVPTYSVESIKKTNEEKALNRNQPNLRLSEEDMEEDVDPPQVMTIFSEEGESQEDCILGV